MKRSSRADSAFQFLPNMHSHRCAQILLALAAALLSFPAAAQEITWSAPEDGGTPRDASRIEKMGPLEFRIRTVFQDGGESVLRHAVSRMDLVCHNAGDHADRITLHLDLSD